MALGLAAKKEIVAEVSEVASRALSVAVAEYRGMEVAELTDLRVKAREQGVYLKVVRNTLAKRALADSQFADLDSALTGPLIYGFSIDAPGGAARLFKDFGKTNDKLKVTALSIGSGLLGPEKLDAVAALPTRCTVFSLAAAENRERRPKQSKIGFGIHRSVPFSVGI